VVRALQRKPELAETLVGVIGDLSPAQTAVSLKFLLRLMSA